LPFDTLFRGNNENTLLRGKYREHNIGLLEVHVIRPDHLHIPFDTRLGRYKENTILREENTILREENTILREENTILRTIQRGPC
jgi:hypothetical protein